MKKKRTKQTWAIYVFILMGWLISLYMGHIVDNKHIALIIFMGATVLGCVLYVKYVDIPSKKRTKEEIAEQVRREIEAVRQTEFP